MLWVIEYFKSKRILIFITAVLLGIYISTLSPLGLINLLFVTMVLTGIYPLLRASVEGRFDIFEPIYLFTAYFIVAMGLRGLIVSHYGSSYLNPIYDISSFYFRSLMIKVFLFSTFVLILIYAGYYSRVGNILARGLPRWGRFKWSKAPLILTVIFCSFIGIASSLILIRKLGGLSYVIKNPTEVVLFRTKGEFWLISLTKFSVFGFLLIYLYGVGRKKALWEKFLMLLNMMVVIIAYLATSSKLLLFGMFFTIILIRHYLRGKMSARTVFLLIAGIFLISYFNFAYRVFGLEFGLLFSQFTFILKNPLQLLTPLIGRAYGADSFAIILDKTPRLIDYQVGNSLLELFYWFIPRALWASKPLSFGLRFGELYIPHSPLAGLSFMTPSLPGELYMNFSYPGLILGSLIFGIFLKTIYSYLILERRDRISVLLYSYILLNSVFFVEGPMAVHIEFLLVDVFLLATIFLLMEFISK
jgi:oligosaccharide repeat unit polymerase